MSRSMHPGATLALACAFVACGWIASAQGPVKRGAVSDGPAAATAWGKPVEGLQAGIRWSRSRPDTKIAGEARFALVVRNVTDHPIEIAYYPVQEKFGWTATTRNGIDVLITPAAPTRAYRNMPLGPAVTIRIEPRKEIVVPGKGPQFSLAEPGSRIFTGRAIVGAPGLKMTVQAQPLEPVAKGEEWLSHLLTGKLEFVVERPPKAGAGSPTESSGLALAAQESPRNAAAEGWGAPVDGLQVGLVPLTDKRVYKAGDSLAFELRARNLSRKPMDFNLKVPDFADLSLVSDNLLTVQTGSGRTVPFHLDPGEERTLPHGVYVVRILGFGSAVATPAPVRRPGRAGGTAERDDSTVLSAALRLLPGEYTLRCSEPVWVVDAVDPNRATAHRAKPGDINFRVSGFAFRAPRESSIVSGMRVFWGHEVDGLQGGIALSSGDRPSANELPLAFFIRNDTRSPMAISYPANAEFDWSPTVVDSTGTVQPVRTIYVTGLREMRHTIIAPGAAVIIGKTRTRLLTQEPPRGDGIQDGTVWLPMLVAKPGRYTASLVDNVRLSNSRGMEIVLETGRVEFVIPDR